MEERVVARVKAMMCAEITWMLFLWSSSRFKRMATMVEEEVVIKVTPICDGTESFHPSFLSHHISYRGHIERVINKYGQFREIYKESEDFTKKRKNDRHLGGVVSYHLLDDIKDLE
jgi:hypothetical protein